MLATTAFALLILSAALSAVFMFYGKKESVSSFLVLAAAIALFSETARRSFLIGFPALTGTFESLVFYAAVLCLLLGVYGLQKRLPVLHGLRFGLVLVAVALLAVASSPLAPKAVQPPVPALKSGWLVMHVAFSFVGEAFFAVSFIASVLFLAARGGSEAGIARKKQLSRITYVSVMVGFPVFTVGALMFGAIWAEAAWGRWWSWDPKETWALVTWLVYTVYLHVRLVMKRDDSLAVWVSVIGFACTLFTFFGVNFLLSGLHSYF